MSSFAFFLFCLQACLIQTAFSQVLPIGLNTYGLNGIGNSVGAEVAYNGPSAGVSLSGPNFGVALNPGLNYGNLNGVSLGSLGNGVSLGSVGSLGNTVSLGSLANGVVTSTGFAPVPDVAAITSLPATGPYVANGMAEMGVAGEVLASGTTIVTGQVPVMGAVSFGGEIPAYGVVSIAGNCGCGGLQF